MKKIFLMVVTAMALGFTANAQTVIANDYGSPITGADGQSISSDNDSENESFSAVGFMYYSFDGFENYGIFFGGTNPNSWGLDFGLRAQIKDHGNYNTDFLINYSFGLWAKKETQLLLTLAAGPSFRLQDKIDGYDNRGNIEYKSGFFVDGVLNPRLSVKFGNVVLTGGYFYWAPKFKFSKSDGATGGFNIGLGYCF